MPEVWVDNWNEWNAVTRAMSGWRGKVNRLNGPRDFRFKNRAVKTQVVGSLFGALGLVAISLVAFAASPLVGIIIGWPLAIGSLLLLFFGIIRFQREVKAGKVECSYWAPGD